MASSFRGDSASSCAGRTQLSCARVGPASDRHRLSGQERGRNSARHNAVDSHMPSTTSASSSPGQGGMVTPTAASGSGPNERN